MCKIDRSEMITNRLTREVSELKAHSMNYNLVFSFDRSTDSNKEIGGEHSIASVTCPEDVIAGLHRVIKLPGLATATYLVYAYRIDNGSKGITEHFNSDGDQGTGGKLLKTLIWRHKHSTDVDYGLC